jgi:two-component system LytT family response regulator
MKMISTLIVDDEPLARQGMRDLLSAHPEIEIVGEASRISEAQKWVIECAPDLIFLDIQLYGESGFDLLDDLPEEIAVIFVTAFNRFAVRAFEVNALDYLLKPVSPERLAVALARHQPPTAPAQLENNDRIYLQLGRKRWFEPIKNIAAICSDNDYSCIWLNDGREVVERRSLKEWEETLPSKGFMRIHRNSIVNLATVKKVNTSDRGALQLHIIGFDFPLEVSRRRSAECRTRLGM